jgi:hypothetical protein
MDRRIAPVLAAMIGLAAQPCEAQFRAARTPVPARTRAPTRAPAPTPAPAPDRTPAGDRTPATDQAPAADDTIVVTADAVPPPTRGDVVSQAQQLSRVGRYKLYEEALPRFEAPVCPEVIGLRDDYASAITDRIRTNLARMDLPRAGPDCMPNLIVAFVADGQTLVSELATRHAKLFGEITPEERVELLDRNAPVRVWNSITKRWTGLGSPPDGWPKQRPSVRGQIDRTSLPEANDISTALVVFERDATLGLTLTQLADYATMRGLSHTRGATGDEPMATILALFAAGGDGPPELTSFDIGYLRSLYAGAANRSAVSKFLTVRREATRGETKGENR